MLRVLSMLVAFAFIGTVASPGPAEAAPLRVTVDPTTYFDDDPAWFLSFRASLGAEFRDAQGGSVLYPGLGIVLDRALASHFSVGGSFSARLTPPFHLRIGFRNGVIFQRRRLYVGTGTMLGMLVVPETREWGAVPTWWFEARYRLTSSGHISIFAEADMLFDALGFERDRLLFSGGIGWTWSF